MGGKIFREFHAESKIFEAYFVDGQNLADQDLLAKLAGEVGLSTQEATEVLENRLYKEV